MDKLCKDIKVGIFDVLILHEIAEILLTLVKVMFSTTRPVTHPLPFKKSIVAFDQIH